MVSKSGLVCLIPDDGSAKVWTIVHPSFPCSPKVSFHNVNGSLELLFHRKEYTTHCIGYDVDFIFAKWQAFKEANK